MPLNYAVVGYGPRALIDTLCIRNKGKLVAGFDPNPVAQAKLKKKGAKTAGSFEELIEMDIDAIIIGSPPQFHAEQSKKAIEKGIHVFSEVPMALNREDVEELIRLDEKNPETVYMLGENTAYHAEVLYAAHLMESGKLGPAVYCETEYLHDVSYRWRGKNVNDYKNSPVKSHWYSLFDPLMYAHSILPAQVAMGGLNSPAEFEEVSSYANDIGGDDSREAPVCAPAKCFHVGLFKTREGAIAKCSSAYVFAREPSRYICTLTGRYGTFENYKKGSKSYLFLADGFNITKFNHRKGSKQSIGKRKLTKITSLFNPLGENQRVIDEWLNAIEQKRPAAFRARMVANATMSGIAASESARTGKPVKIPLYRI